MRFHRGYAALLAPALFLGGCGHSEQAAPAPRIAIAVHAQAAHTASVDRYSGTVQARYASPLSFRISGKIVERAVNLGETVHKGQILARLDDADARLALQAADAAADAAQTQNALAQRELDRARKLRAKALISQASFDTRKNRFEVASAQLSEAHKRADMTRNQLGYTRLRADHDGVITRVSAEVGQVVTAGQPVFGLAQDGSREFVVDVPETRIDAIRHAQAVTVDLWALPGRKFGGQVREIAADADPATRTFQVRIALTDNPGDLRLGMSGTAKFEETPVAKAVSLPLTSLYHAGDKPAVWVVDPKTGTVTLRTVRIARYRTQAVDIASGLSPGEIVIAKGVQKLHAGEKVVPRFSEAD